MGAKQADIHGLGKSNPTKSAERGPEACRVSRVVNAVLWTTLGPPDQSGGSAHPTGEKHHGRAVRAMQIFVVGSALNSIWAFSGVSQDAATRQTTNASENKRKKAPTLADRDRTQITSLCLITVVQDCYLQSTQQARSH
jgi:hypothetical protein